MIAETAMKIEVMIAGLKPGEFRAATTHEEWSANDAGTNLRFFFQAEDGIRDDLVTGVQTCALPISRRREDQTDCLTHSRRFRGRPPVGRTRPVDSAVVRTPRETSRDNCAPHRAQGRSEERRVGKECK